MQSYNILIAKIHNNTLHNFKFRSFKNQFSRFACKYKMFNSIYTSLLAFGKGQVVLFSISLSDLVASTLYVYLDLKSRTKQD